MKVIKGIVALSVFTISITIHMNAQQTTSDNATLTKKELSIVSIAAFTANGDLTQLCSALNVGLDAGLTINETKEILVQLYAYAGFPRSLNALNTLMSVLDERKNKGIKDEQGKTAAPYPSGKTKLQFGTENQTKLVGQPVKGLVYEFAPAIDQFLKEHLFGDIFGRDNLSWKTREIATIAALASLGGTEHQLRSHINVGIYNGLTQSQLNNMAEVLNTSLGASESNSMKNILNGINKEKIKTGPNTSKISNPYTLVYDGAIAENVAGKVNIHPVTYRLNGIDIAANVYTPAGYDPSKKYPAIVVAHPNGGVKEQTAGLYAQSLAEAGYITIAADAAYQGASGGEPRHTDKPVNRTEDIHGMADFITQYKGVDTSRVAAFGICGGGGYTLKAAQSDKRLKAVATLSMFNSGEVRRNGFQNSQLNSIQERLKKASAAREQEAAGGKIIYAGVASITDEEIAKTTTDLYREGYQYYYRTNAHPNSTFLYPMSNLLDLMTWDATTNMDLINQPLLMMAGSKADTKYMTDEAFSKATNASDKELFLIEGATHIQTYWKPEYVSAAVQKLTNFFEKNLK